MAKNKLSIVIPCYSGQDTIHGVLESIIKQLQSKNVEVVVVIDGPNEQIKNIVDKFFEINGKVFSSYKIKQFDHNKGAFAARYEGASLATHDKLLFIDDRTEMTDDYLENILGLIDKQQVVISNIIEKFQPNFISKTLYILRKKLYKNWGSKFKPYYINKQNFDRSPKGTAGLFVDSHIFFEASKKFMSMSNSDKNSSDDTKLLKFIVEISDIYRSSELKLLYIPRGDWRKELAHIYKRGPKFIDYYLAPGSPYFLYLVVLYIVTVATVIMAIIYPISLVYVIIGLLLLIFIAGWLTGKKILEKFGLMLGMMYISLAFIFGIYVGTMKRFFR